MPWQPITVRYVHSSSPKLAGFYRRVPIFYILLRAQPILLLFI